MLAINDSNFEEMVINSQIPVLLDFWAPWCGPCRMISPIVEELSKEYEGKTERLADIANYILSRDH